MRKDLIDNEMLKIWKAKTDFSKLDGIKISMKWWMMKQIVRTLDSISSSVHRFTQTQHVIAQAHTDMASLEWEKFKDMKEQRKLRKEEKERKHATRS